VSAHQRPGRWAAPVIVMSAVVGVLALFAWLYAVSPK
jgi:hypothetical protein